MSVSSLSGLWFGLALPAIVLLYLLKRHYIDTVVPSHLLWNRVLRESEANRPWQKLRSSLLLLLQLLVAALIVFALLRPYASSGANPDRPLIVVLDRSASMEAAYDNGGSGGRAGSQTSLLDEAVRRIGQYVREQPTGRPVTIVTAGTEPDVIVARETNRSAIDNALKQTAIDYGRIAYKETLSLASALSRDSAQAEVRLYTDGRWTEAATGIAFPSGIETIVLRPAYEGNVGIAQFGANARAGASATDAVAVLYNSGLAVAEIDVTLAAADGQTFDSRRETIQPGERKTVQFHDLPHVDTYRLTIATGGDAFAFDNVTYAKAARDEQAAVRALLVGPGNLFLEQALRLAGADVVKASGGGKTPLGAVPQTNVDLVVVDSVDSAPLSAAPWKELLARKPVWYVNAGTETGAGAGEETPTTAMPGAAYEIADHPVMQYLKLADTHISRLLQVDPSRLGWSERETIVSAGGLPLIVAGAADGQRRLLFAFDLHQSDLPLRSEFPILVHHAAHWLLEGRQQDLGRIVAGSRLDMAPSADAADASWLPLGAPGNRAAAAVSAIVRGGAPALSQQAPLVPGLYAYEQRDAAGRAVSRAVAEIVADPREAAQAAANDPLATAGRHGGGNEATRSDAQHDAAADSRLHSLIPWIALFALLLLYAEWGVYRRGSALR
ncbi:vWA domain-containing protein [Paenibacillus cymbidii]|uniref:vWA domain-containing protein n=1 Tax=Paenibacillus cymbidii TaxID=1639034 RepID=UPI001080BFB8|nr:VWA domain-containing protein [Paenibacillus cymbidii]